MQVKKRDGNLVKFSDKKIIQAINKAMDETELGIDEELSKKITEEIFEENKNNEEIDIETIQNQVEIKLMHSNRADVAKKYLIYREKRRELRENPKWNMNELQSAILKNKYIQNNENFNGWLERISGGNKAIKKIILDRKALPAGRILAGRGMNEKKMTLSNCFVLPEPKDNLESIFDTAKEMARTYSYGGGVGINIGKLRPYNSKVNNSAKTTSGAISFMDLYSLTTELICQHGRRGALMISIPDSHPDLIDFIKIKSDLDKVTKANISIMFSDEFFQAVENDEIWEMKFVVEDTGEEIVRTKPAKEIFKMVCKMNWDMAEPGILWWSRIENYNLLSEDKEFKYVGVNP